jgi:hypothetical protein
MGTRAAYSGTPAGALTHFWRGTLLLAQCGSWDQPLQLPRLGFPGRALWVSGSVVQVTS